jgi:hypothetical protein
MNDMNNNETRIHLFEWVRRNHNLFEWPTDACGYEQHIKYVDHRNKNWKRGTPQEYKRFIIDYVNSLVEG